jgi:hypothetical protein
VSGKVTSISPDTKPDERLGAVYRVEVSLAQSYLTANHQNIKLKAGETATAEIIIRRRRIADLLLDPIRQLQKGASTYKNPREPEATPHHIDEHFSQKSEHHDSANPLF